MTNFATDRATPPQTHDPIEFDYPLKPINREKLGNGVPVFWLNAGTQEVVEVDFVLPAGLWQEPQAGLAQAAAGMLRNGTRTRKAAEIHEALEFYGANLKVHAHNDYVILSLYSLTKHLPELLPVVFDILTEAQFPESELEIYKKNAIQKLAVNLRQCEFVANQQIDAMLFGPGHPYGRFTQRGTIEAVTREQLLKFYQSAYRLSGLKIFMGGKIDGSAVAALDQVFGKAALEGGAMTEPEHQPQPAPDRMRDIENDAQGVQGAIRIGRSFPNRHHPDFSPMVVLNTLFGGYFGSRLMANIREEKGFTYGIYSTVYSYDYGGSLTVHTEVGKDVVEPAVQEIYAEMEKLTREPADEEELLLVKNYLLGGLLGDLESPFSILQRWRTLILNGFDASRFHNNIALYKSITSEELQALAKKYYKPEEFYQVVVV